MRRSVTEVTTFGTLAVLHLCLFTIRAMGADAMTDTPSKDSAPIAELADSDLDQAVGGVLQRSAGVSKTSALKLTTDDAQQASGAPRNDYELADDFAP